NGGGQSSPRVQGGAQRHRRAVSGLEARLLLRLPRKGVALLHTRGGVRAGAAAAVRPVRYAHDRRGLRLLPPGRTGPPVTRCPVQACARLRRVSAPSSSTPRPVGTWSHWSRVGSSTRTRASQPT